MNSEDNFKNLCDLTTSLVGLPKGSLSIKNRELKYQVPRMIAAMISRIEDGTHRDVIAKVLNRHRTSINHYEVRHAQNYATFPKYRDTFNLIYNAYSDIKDAKYTFKDMYHLKKYLKDNGIYNSDKHQTTIRIICGKFGTDIKVSYREFYNKFELCKLALQNYQYEIEVV